MNGGGVDAVDQEKLTGLMALWIEHEFWIQAGCPESQRHWIVFPGYASIAEQDVRGYDAYRHSLVPYFAEAQGFRGIHDSLQKLVGDAEAKHPALFNELMAQYEDPDGRFRAQWGNLFCSIFNDGLSHRTLLDYQKKFEIELPLCFLAQLRELVTKGSFDKNLDRCAAGSYRRWSAAPHRVEKPRTTRRAGPSDARSTACKRFGCRCTFGRYGSANRNSVVGRSKAGPFVPNRCRHTRFGTGDRRFARVSK